MQEKKYFRLLEVGDKIQMNDLFVHPSQVLNEVESYHIGKALTPVHVPHFRPVQVDEWIPYAEQKPTGGADELVDTFNGKRTNSFFVRNVPQATTHWRRITPPVPIIQRVKVDQHEVIPQPDGSLKVGCQTIPSEQFEEIVRQRAAAMEKGQ